MKPKILIVDDDRGLCEAISDHLGLHGFSPSFCLSAPEALEMVKESDFDTILSDLKMPEMNGLELCERIVANRPDIPVVVITAFGSLETAVEAMRAGAYDFVTKPIEMAALTLALGRSVKHRALLEKVRILSNEVARADTYDELLGSSSPMKRLFRQLNRISDAEDSVLIVGESGTGKELVARALHQHGGRRDRPFIAVNCAALPEALIESELFGHVRGAFSGASSARRGMFQQADGGTLFLDEVGELPYAMQPKLLRALEAGTVRPVGGDHEIQVDIRFLAATNRDLERAVEEERFRSDLFFRLNVIQIVVPPLRARGSDILLLAQHFLESCAARTHKDVRGISEAAAEKLLRYRWPGNVRELRNAIARAVALTRFSSIAVDDLPDSIRAYRAARLVLDGSNPEELVSLEEVERRYIRHVLESVGGNRSQAARILGVDRKTLYRKLRSIADEHD